MNNSEEQQSKIAVSQNKRLQQQILNFTGNHDLPEKYVQLFEAISASYDYYEQENKMLSSFIDLGSVKMIELNGELKKERDDLANLLENIEAVYFSFNAKETSFIQLSVACEKVTSYTPEEFKARPQLWKTILHPDDKDTFEGGREKLNPGKPVIYQYRIIHKNKSVHWVENKVIPTFDKNGVLERMDGLLTDITEKKLAEEKIIQSEALISEAQKMAKMGNWSADVETGEVIWSEGLRAIHGVSEALPASFENFIKLVHPDDRNRLFTEITQLHEMGGSLESEYRIIRFSDDEERIFHTIFRAVKNKDGKLVRVFGLTKDITERRTAELKVEELNLLMYQIGHDLRGPINSAKNYIFLALKRVKEEAARNYLVKIQDSYSKIENRIISLLNLQRLNRAKLRTEQINFKLMVDEIIGSADSIIGHDTVKISADIQLPEIILSDKQYLHSIVHNLVTNAIAHNSTHANAFVHISANIKNNLLTICVADNGPGIPESMRETIFDKFVKGSASDMGTGLGLYIVKNLVEKLRGTISFLSNADKGTTFTVTIPYKN